MKIDPQKMIAWSLAVIAVCMVILTVGYVAGKATDLVADVRHPADMQSRFSGAY
jgi:hypothetical protein